MYVPMGPEDPGMIVEQRAWTRAEGRPPDGDPERTVTTFFGD
jgi:hypothetical protein